MIALTADLHLTRVNQNPERFHALENILAQLVQEKVSVLFLLGDVFHENTQNYGEFEALCRDPRYRSIQFHLIPGNHDSRIVPSFFSAENIIVHTQPEVFFMGEKGFPILCVPYCKEKTMGEEIIRFRDQLAPYQWILFSHGDWVEGLREPHPMEPGVYMPLTRTDVEALKPACVILGHIHKPTDREMIHYPGSPCGLDITETGLRRFLLLDPVTAQVTPRMVQTQVVFFSERLVLLPVEEEEKYIRDVFDSMKKAWGISEKDLTRVRLRLEVTGYTRDKKALEKTIRSVFHSVSFFPNGEPDLSEVSVTEERNFLEIAEVLKREIETVDWPKDPYAPSKQEAFLHALRILFGLS